MLTEKQIAIKTMKKSFESLGPCLELREVVFLRTLPNHVHLVPALDIFLDPFSKKLHIAMEYMEGNLYQLMKARDHKSLDGASVKSILFQIMQGLEHIHDHHFFHRDIKPENILVSTSAPDTGLSFRRYSSLVTPPPTPPNYTVKIADFGLARETHSKLPYTTYVSTRWYRAPEVLLRAGEYSAPVDIWAIGAMAVEIATLKPLFPGGNEVDQVWRVCEIMGSPGNWYNKNGARVGGGDWKEGTRLAGKLGFSFPKMAPHAMDTILQAPQWPAEFSQFVTWCLMWDPKNRPTSAQALAHGYFNNAVDPLRPKSSASKMLGRKQSDLSYRSSRDFSAEEKTITSKPSWFRKSLIGRSENSTASSQQTVVAKENISAPRPMPVHSLSTNEVAPKLRPQASKRATWSNGPSNVAPMPILPTIRPISPVANEVPAQANTRSVSFGASGKIGRQLSVASKDHYDAEAHRQQAERALNGQTGLISPPISQKESFFSHLRKRARRFSGRHQTPITPNTRDLESGNIGCGPWQSSNRSSMVVDSNQLPTPTYKDTQNVALDKALRVVKDNLENQPPNGGYAPVPPAHQIQVKRNHSLQAHQQTRSADNLIGARTAPISSRTRRSQAVVEGVRQYSAPDEEDELLDEAMTETDGASERRQRRLDRNSTQDLVMTGCNDVPECPRQIRLSQSKPVMAQPYPTPSPTANGNHYPFNHPTVTSQPQRSQAQQQQQDDYDARHKWPTPPYDGNGNDADWSDAAVASIWAAGNRF